MLCYAAETPALWIVVVVEESPPPPHSLLPPTPPLSFQSLQTSLHSPPSPSTHSLIPLPPPLLDMGVGDGGRVRTGVGEPCSLSHAQRSRAETRNRALRQHGRADEREWPNWSLVCFVASDFLTTIGHLAIVNVCVIIILSVGNTQISILLLCFLYLLVELMITMNE